MTRRINSSKGGAHGWLSSARETMLSFLELHFPVEVKEGKDFVSSTQGNDDDVEEIFEHNNSDAYLPRPASQSSSQTKTVGTFDDECVEMRDELIADVKELDLPFSALDMFMETLGGPRILPTLAPSLLCPSSSLPPIPTGCAQLSDAAVLLSRRGGRRDDGQDGPARARQGRDHLVRAQRQGGC